MGTGGHCISSLLKMAVLRTHVTMQYQLLGSAHLRIDSRKMLRPLGDKLRRALHFSPLRSEPYQANCSASSEFVRCTTISGSLRFVSSAGYFKVRLWRMVSQGVLVRTAEVRAHVTMRYQLLDVSSFYKKFRNRQNFL